METEFRGKRLDGTWVYGYYCRWENRHYITSEPHESGFSGGEVLTHSLSGFMTVDPASVGMFTGVLDKNKRKVYKGDIVIYPWAGGTYSKGYIEYRTEDYSRPGYVCVTIGDDENGETISFDSRCEIIGNVTDTPELMEAK